MNYFVINKQLDYERGFLQGLEYRDGRLRLREDTADKGYFFSRLFDSGVNGTVWHRFTAERGTSGETGVKFSFFCFDSPELMAEERKISVTELVQDKTLTPRDKIRLMESHCRIYRSGSWDILLHAAEGRYLMVLVEIFRRESDNSVGDMCLYFPRETWMRFLPGVYSKNKETADFTERFLSIFQTLYDDREMEIQSSAGLIHPSTAGRALLEELAGWYGMKDLYLWPDENLRELVRRAPLLTQKIGTAEGLREYLHLYLGTEPVIEESREDPYSFTVLVPEEFIDETIEFHSLVRVIGHMKPAGMTVRVAPLARKKNTGAVFRLGMSSRLEGEEPDGENL